MSDNQTPAVVDLDDLIKAELDQRVAETLTHIEEIRKLWPGLVRLSEQERTTSIGRSFSRFRDPLRKLLVLLVPPQKGQDTALGKIFNILANEDRGDDPDRFEAELLLRRIDRVEAQQKVLAQLEDLTRHMGDDTLHTAEAVVTPGLTAMELARTVSKTNAEHRSALAPVLDALREMTKQARKGRKKTDK